MEERRVPPGGIWRWEHPDPAAAPTSLLAEHERVWLIDVQSPDGWARIRTADGGEAWVNASQLLVPAPAVAPAPPVAPVRRAWLPVAVGVLLAAAIVAPVAYLVLSDDTDPVVGTAPSTTPTTVAATTPTSDGTVATTPEATAPVPTTAGSASATTQPSVPSAPSAPDDERPGEPSAIHDFDEAMLAEVIAAAAGAPSRGLPAADPLATSRLRSDLAEYDLTGIEISVYPPHAAPALALFRIDESAPLLEAEGAGDQFIRTVIGSSVLDDIAVEDLLVEFEGVDEEGSYVISFLVGLDDLRSLETDGGDITDIAHVQVDRP